MRARIQLLQFHVGDLGFALDLAAVECVLPAVELDPLPGSPPVIRGIFSLHGTIVPVADPRRRLGLAERAVALADWIVVVRTGRRLLGLLIEPGTSLAECDAAGIVPVRTILHGIEAVEGVVRTADGLLLIQDPARFLTVTEALVLDEALHAHA